jgi:hypothetical protein
MSERRMLGLLLPMIGYYAVLGFVAWLAGRWLIPLWGHLVAPRTPGGAAVALLAGLALMCPVAWMYMRTKPKARYDSSLVQTIIVLPIVISGVVVIVRDSVALAFSLAGIVAAVRFRNTLRDTKDAVYIFLAIAVGLAAGVQALATAFVVTVIFALVVLVLWRFDVGTEPLADSFRGRLIVEAPWAPGVETAVAAILERYARRWKLVRTEPKALTFAVQVLRSTTPDALVAAVRDEPSKQVTGVRFDPLGQ